MDETALSTLISSLLPYAIEAKKPPLERGNIPWQGVDLNFEAFRTYVLEPTFKALLAKIKVGAVINPQLAQLTKEFTQPDYLSSENPKLDDNLRNFAEALRIFLELEKSEDAGKKLASAKEEPLGVLAQRLKVGLAVQQEFTKERQKLIADYKPLLSRSLEIHLRLLKQLFPQLKEHQLALLQQQLLDRSSTYDMRNFLMKELAVDDFQKLEEKLKKTNTTIEQFDRFVSQTALVQNLTQEAINHVFTISLQQDALQTAFQLLPRELIEEVNRNPRARDEVVRVLTNPLYLNSLTPEKELSANLLSVAQSYGVKVSHPLALAKEIIDSLPHPTEAMISPLLSQYLTYQPYQQVKEELKESIKKRLEKLPGLPSDIYIERLVDVAIEESLQIVVQAEKMPESPERQMARAINRILKKQGISLSPVQQGALIEVLKGQLAMHAELFSVVENTLSKASEIVPQLTEIQAKDVVVSIRKPSEIDVVTLAQETLAKVLVDYHALLSPEQSADLVGRLVNHISVAKKGVNVKEAIAGGIYLAIADLSKDERLKLFFSQVLPDGMTIDKLVLENISQFLDMEVIDFDEILSLPKEQRIIKLRLLVHAALKTSLVSFSQKITKELINQQQTAKLIDYLKSEKDALNLFVGNLFADALKPRQALMEKIAQQLIAKDGSMKLLGRYFAKKKGNISQVFLITRTLFAPAAGFLQSLRQKVEGVGQLENLLGVAKYGILPPRLHPPSLFSVNIFRLRLAVGRLTSIKISPGVVLSSYLKQRFPAFYKDGHFILGKSGLSSIFKDLFKPDGFFPRFFAVIKTWQKSLRNIFPTGSFAQLGQFFVSLLSPFGRGFLSLVNRIALSQQVPLLTARGTLVRPFLPRVLIPTRMLFIFFSTSFLVVIIFSLITVTQYQTAFVTDIGGGEMPGEEQPVLQPPTDPGPTPHPGVATDCPLPSARITCGSFFTPATNGCGHCNQQYLNVKEDERIKRLGYCANYLGNWYALDIAGTSEQEIKLPQINGHIIEWKFILQNVSNDGKQAIQKYSGTDTETGEKYLIQFHHTEPGSGPAGTFLSGAIGGKICKLCSHVHVQLGTGALNPPSQWLDSALFFCR